MYFLYVSSRILDTDMGMQMILRVQELLLFGSILPGRNDEGIPVSRGNNQPLILSTQYDRHMRNGSHKSHLPC